MNDALFNTDWNATTSVLATRLSGVLSPDHVGQWEQELQLASRAVPPDSTFTMLVDIHGYEVDDQDREVHQRQRVVIPTFLARHGFEVGYFRLLDVENTIPADPTLPRCTAVAHVHHDFNKMSLYNEKIGSDVERFFTSRDDAAAWLATKR